MKCPFVKGTYMYSCAASRDVYVPSEFELNEYCRSTRYTICPLYCRAAADGKFRFNAEGVLHRSST